MQAGIQLEWMTGGYIKAGFHEVVHNEKAEERKQQQLKAGKCTWRVASTLFTHLQGDQNVGPLAPFRSP